MFKRVALPIAVAAALYASGAQAADLGVPLRGSEVVEPHYEHVDKWSGAYLGGHVGLQIWRNSGFHSDALGTANPNFPNFAYDYGGTQVNYGLHAGFQRLFGTFLLGVEVDVDGPQGLVRSPWYNGDPAYSGGVPGNSYQQRMRADMQGSLRARFGFVHKKTLFYATAGLAWGRFTVCTVLDDCVNGASHVVRYAAWRTGWTVGAGIEHKFNYNWSLRAEYRYTNFGSRTCLSTDPCSIDPNASDIGNRIESHTVRVGVTYLFGVPPAPAPVVARY
jgi:outer membrane immunogenic protein